MKYSVANTHSEEFKPKFVLHPKRFKSDSECSLDSSQCGLLKGLQLQQLQFGEDEFESLKILQRPTTSCLGARYEGRSKSKVKMSQHTSIPKTNITNSSATFTMSVCGRDSDKKIKSLIERALSIINKIHQILQNGCPLPDGDEDYQRRIKRLHEFSARFSRIYLYPLQRQINELNASEKMNSNHMNKKISCAQQTVLQGLQAYCNHLPTSVEKCCVDKLSLLLNETLRLCDYCEFYKGESNDCWEFINALRKQINLLLKTIEVFNSIFIKEKTTEPKNKATSKKKLNTLFGNNNSIKTKSKLSMYTSHVSTRLDHRIFNNYGKKIYCVKSKYMQAGYKHRPSPKQETNEPSKMTNSIKKPLNSSKLLQNTPRKAYVRDEDVPTMIESNVSLQSEYENVIHENNHPSCRELVRDKDRIIFKNTKSIKKIELQNFEHNGEKGKDEKIGQMELERKSKQQIVSVTGVRNAKLICIQDNSEFDGDVEKINTSITNLKPVISNIKHVEPEPVLKITKLSNQPRSLKLLSKNWTINIIQYKLLYTHAQKDNPMYKKSERIQPWIIMGRISDNLLDQLLHNISGALEIEEMVENLYQAEFQY